MGAAAQPDLARPDAPSLKPRTLLPHILSRCQFAKWCADNPEKVKEPSWYALAANLCVFEGGEEAFYKLSEGYPAYDPREAERKFWHAAKDSPGPITCQHLAGLGEMGFQCPRLGVCPARSPAALANVSDQEWDALFPPEGTSTDFVKAARLAAAVHLARQGQTRRAIELATTVLRTPQIARQLVHHQASLGKGPGTGRAGG